MAGIFPFDATELASISRLLISYNGNAYNASTNPFGLAYGGHLINFIPSLQDLAIAAQATGAAATASSTSATAAAASAVTAAASAAALQGTSSTSVAIAVGSKTFTTQAGKQFTAGTWLRIYSAANPTTQYMSGQVTSYSSTTLVVNVTVVVGSLTLTDWVIAVSAAPGVQGAQGTPGSNGAQGATPQPQFTFSTATTSTDPGTGIFNFDSATVGSITRLYIDNLDINGVSITAWLDAMDDSTNTALRGTLHFRQLTDPTKWMAVNVSGAVTDSTGFRTIVVSGGVGALPASGQAVAVMFTRTGDKGSDGAGAGDTLSDIAVVVDGRLVKYNGTTGKHITDGGGGIGTSGTNVGFLDSNVIYSGTRTFATTVDVQQQLKLSGDISPTNITADQNDYNPTSLATSSVLRLTSDALRNVTGLQGGADGRVILVFNVGSNNIVLKNASASSSAANRFAFGADVTIGASQSCALWYDSTSTNWRATNPFLAGVSGHVVGYLDGANTISGAQAYAAKVDLQQDVYMSGDISPAQITATQNDYNPTSLSTSSVLRLSTDALRSITGLQGGADGRVIWVLNVGSNSLTLVNESASSSAANRFSFGGDITLGAGQGCTLWYDSTSSRWRTNVSNPIAVGTSGHVVGYLDGANTISGAQAYAAKVDLQQDVYMSGDISPAQITADQNNYTPASLATATVLRLSTDASRSLTGLAASTDGRLITVLNVGSNPLVLAGENASSTAANRFSASITLAAGEGIGLIYDATSSRWRLLATAGSSTLPTTVTGPHTFSGAITFSTTAQFSGVDTHASVIASSATPASGLQYGIDFSGSQITVGSSASASIGNNAGLCGLLVVTDITVTAATGVFLVDLALGLCLIVSQTGTDFVTGTTPGAGKISVATPGSGDLRIYCGSGAGATFSVALLRTH